MVKPGEGQVTTTDAVRIATAAARGNGGGIPDWVKFVVPLVVSLAAGAIGYGEMKAQVNALEQRVDRAEKSAEKLEQAAEQRNRDWTKSLEDVRQAIGGVQLDVARICAKLKC